MSEASKKLLEVVFSTTKSASIALQNEIAYNNLGREMKKKFKKGFLSFLVRKKERSRLSTLFLRHGEMNKMGGKG